MNASSLDQIASAVITAFPKLSEPEQHAALALYRLLAKGRPVTAEELSAASGVPGPAVHDMLARWHGVQRSADGAVTAFWGLTLSKTKHRFRVDGRDLHTWCAWDTLFLPPLLGAVAEVESACPVSAAVIRLHVDPRGIKAAQPGTAVLSFVTPSEAALETSVIESFCCHVHFFASRGAGKEWAGSHASAFLLSLSDAWQIGARKNAAQYSVALAGG